jgi:hypothetical protein
MGRQVAVKELHLAEGLSPEERHHFRERLLREARNAGRLNDPGIVTVYDVITDNGVDHIVMELIEARTLAEVVSTQGPLDERTAVSVAQQLLSALQAAHRAGVAHRDVKPANVMLGQSGRVKLTDFGIAQAADDTRLTGTGLLVGSPGYLSPEQLDGMDATPASDLWALGATLYFAVEGRGPFARDTTAATISAVLQAEIPPARVRGPLGSVIAGLLQRDPQLRLSGPQAAAILGSTATVTLAPGPPPVGRPGSTPQLPYGLPEAARPRRRRVWVWALVALLVGLVAGAGVTYGLTMTAERDLTALTYGPGGAMPEFDASFGSCYLGAPGAGRSLDSGAYRACEETHDSQVFGVVDAYGSSVELAYPGEDALRETGSAFCRMYFDTAVVGDDKDRLQLTLVLPAEKAFTEDTRSPGSSSGYFVTRTMYCVLSAPNGGQLEGSRLDPAFE